MASYAKLRFEPQITMPPEFEDSSMITIAHNKVNRSLDIMLDTQGADLLLQTLQKLKAEGGHLHVYATDDDTGVATWSPYAHEEVFSELVLDFLPSRAWQDTRPK